MFMQQKYFCFNASNIVSSSGRSHIGSFFISTKIENRLAHDVMYTTATHVDLVRKVIETHSLTQNNSLHGRVFATFRS